MKSNFRKFPLLRLWMTVILFIVWSAGPATASTGDSTAKVLSLSEFIQVVKTYHPVARQAQLLPEQARAELLIARGGWDPVLSSVYSSKNYEGVDYYSYFENKISVPLWYGVEVNAGYDYAGGEKLNSESVLPQSGLGYAGVSVSLLKNMFIDRQRAALKQARLFTEASEQQKLLLLNDLLLEALNTYYDWSYAYREYGIYTEAVRVAELRYRATQQGVLYGDKAAIDTTEALTQLQSRQYQLNEARLRFLNKGLALHNYLWLDNNSPRPLDTAIVPAPLHSGFTEQELPLRYLEDLALELQESHPLLLNYGFKLRQLDIERKLKIENLKPTLNAKYHALREQFDFRDEGRASFRNNYALGIHFSMPLSFMQGRGALKQTKLDIQHTRYALDYKRQELLNQLRSIFNELLTAQQQTRLYEQSLEGFRALYEGEMLRFNSGESSLFLVNARESRLLEAQVKLSELQARYFKTEAELKWAVGNIGR
ncbi:MAG: TolC family protein [Bacteroidia bacterium]|nr:TolC family protein [Bacteroidia bacterium]